MLVEMALFTVVEIVVMMQKRRLLYQLIFFSWVSAFGHDVSSLTYFALCFFVVGMVSWFRGGSE